MGVAPHIKTEFWLFAGNDFCLDLKNWTDTILADDGAPKVHSISYGWQGNLTQVGCNPPEVSYIDDNFAALAAKGVSIIFASGDSGSGYGGFRRHTQTKKTIITCIACCIRTTVGRYQFYFSSLSELH